jgi:Mg2+/Co2+ transporter CorB
MTDEIFLSLIAIIILLILSALFACSETSIIAVSRAKINRMANEGNKRAKKLIKLLQSREKIVSTMVVGNNAVNIIVSVLATSIFIELFGEAGLLYATIVLTLVILIFAEIAPKTFALKIPDSMALALVSIIIVLMKFFSPFTLLIQKFVDVFVNLFFAKVSKKTKEAELEEIRDAVNLKAKEGTIFKYDKDLIDGVLDLSDTQISEIMVHRKDIESINIDLSNAEIIKRALSIEHTRIPLWQNDKENIVAILNVRKLLKELYSFQKEKNNDHNIAEFDFSAATSEPWFVPSSNSLRSQLFSFRKKRKRFSLVVDEYGSLLGLLTLEDILEEIVGDIKEQDDELVNIIKIKSGAYKIAGKSLIRDINKRLNWQIEEGDHAYNLAAFVIGSLGRIPEEKENFVLDGYYFEILKRKNHDLILIKVKELKKAEELI